VIDLAYAHQLRTGAYVDGSSTVVGTGTLTIGVGEESFSVEIDSNNNTVAGIAAAINAATGNAGVQATLITGTDGTRLVLTSEHTGSDSALTVAQSGGDGGLQVLVYDPDGIKNLTQLHAAQDARISIAGIEATSSTNVFSDAIEGVTISIKAKPEVAHTTVGLTVTRNLTATTDAVKKFVSAYNAMQGEIAKQRSFDPATRAAGPLFGDTMLRGIESQIRNALNNPIEGAGTFATLASIGIKTSAAGKLELDDAKLTAAIEADPAVVTKLFGADNGIAERMYALMKDKLGSSAEIESRNTGLTNGLKQIDAQKAALETRLQTVQARLLKQFTALDSLLSGMQSTSAFLSQQLANLPGTSNNK
jgi:flagellar hook-associated protein 2